eukprot:9475014-Pyramimonas_sp.AAC.1
MEIVVVGGCFRGGRDAATHNLTSCRLEGGWSLAAVHRGVHAARQLWRSIFLLTPNIEDKYPAMSEGHNPVRDPIRQSSVAEVVHP